MLAAAAGDEQKTKRPVIKSENFGHVRLSISLDHKTMDRLQKLKLLKQLTLEKIISLASELLERQEQEKIEARFKTRVKLKRAKSKSQSKTHAKTKSRSKNQSKTESRAKDKTQANSTEKTAPVKIKKNTPKEKMLIKSTSPATVKSKTPEEKTNFTSPATVSRYIPKKVRRAA